MNKTISFYRSDNQIMNDAIDRVVVEIHNKKREFGHKTILMTGCNSNCGTTTNAINLSIALSVAGWKTVLVDCDLRKNSKYKRLNNDTEFGLSDYLGIEKCEKEEIAYHTSYEGLDYIPSGESVESPIRLLCTPKMEKLLDELENNYDYVILDLPSVNAVSDADILMAKADEIILVLEYGYTTKKQYMIARGKVEKYREQYAGILVNRLDLDKYKYVVKDFDYFSSKKIDKQYKKKIDEIRKKQRKTKSQRLEEKGELK